MFSGVLSAVSIGTLKALPSRLNIIEKTSIENNAVSMAVLSCSIFLAPKSCEITTEQPIPVPTATITKSMVMDVEAPTAARASAPTILPTIILSTILYSCWNMFPRIIGMAKDIRPFATLPSVRFIFFFSFLILVFSIFTLSTHYHAYKNVIYTMHLFFLHT